MAAQLYQMFAWGGTSTGAATETGTTWAFTPPEKAGAGNRYLLALSYPTQTEPTIAINGTNQSASVGKISGGANDLTLWDIKNLGGGAINTIKATFGAATQPVSGELWEFSGLSTTLANSGVSAGVANATGPNLTAGSLTPTNNDSNGGNLVCAFFYDAFDGGDAGPTSFSAGTNFSMMQGNCITNGNAANGLPMASEFFVQATAAAINPGMTATGDTTTGYNSIAIALPLSPGAGTPRPNQLWIVKTLKITTNFINNATSAKTNFPTQGNFRAFHTTTDDTVVTALSDTDGSYTNQGFGASRPAFYYAKNKSADAANVLTLTFSPSQTTNCSLILYDIDHAATVTPIGATGNNQANTGAAQTSVAHQPDITPQSTSSKILASLSNGNGPTNAITAPSGATYLNITIDGTGGQDGGLENQGDAHGTLANTSTAAQSWTWTIAAPGGTGSTVFTSAVEILPAAAAAGTWGFSSRREDERPALIRLAEYTAPFFRPSQSAVPARWQPTTGQEDRPPPPSRRPDDSSIENRRWFLQSPNPVPTRWQPTTGQEDRPPPPRMRPDDSAIENRRWFVQSPSPVPTSVLPTTGQEDRPPPPSRRPDDSSIEEPQWFLRSVSPVPTWQPTAGEHDHPPVIKRPPDEPTGWFLKAVIQNTTPNQWLSTTGGDLEHPVPPRRTDWAPQWFSPPVPHPNQWLPTTGEDLEHPAIVQPRTDWAPQWFVQSPSPVPQRWLPTTGEAEHPVPPPRIDWTPQWFVLSPNPVPTTWLPTTGQEDRAPVQKRPPDEPGAFFRSPVTVVGIAGMAWWRQTEVYFNVPPPQMDYHPAWDPQFVVQIAPPHQAAVYANPFIVTPGPMTSIPGNPPS